MNTNILDELLSATPYELHELRHDLRHHFVALNSVYNDDGSIDLVRKHEHERLVAIDEAVDKLLEVGQTRTTAKVILFKDNGKYYTEEEWRIPERCTTPHDMTNSPDFHRIANGPVLFSTQEPWGFPVIL